MLEMTETASKNTLFQGEEKIFDICLNRTQQRPGKTVNDDECYCSDQRADF